MSPTEPVREPVLALFKRHRARPGSPFDEEHFLDFLLANSKQVGAVKNSFRGLRRFNAFIDATQLEFVVFFSIKDREANYSLNAFVKRVEFLTTSKRSSLTSLRNYARYPFGWHVVILFDVVAIGVCWTVARHSQTVALILALVALLVNAALARLFLYEQAYVRRITNLLRVDAPR